MTGTDVEPIRGNLPTVLEAARQAITNRQGVALVAVLAQLHADGHTDLADMFVDELATATARAIRAAGHTDPEVLARAFDLIDHTGADYGR